MSPELADRLRGTGEDTLRRVAATVGGLAAKSMSLTDPRLERALSELAQQRAERNGRDEVEALVQELDEQAWKIQARVHSGRLQEDEYLRAFRKARAASSVAFAMDPDPQTAAMEAVYEAQAAVGGIGPVKAAVLDILGR